MGKQEKCKRRRDESFNFAPRLSNELSIFPLMLASLANLHHHYAQTLLKKCLHKLQKTLEEASSNPPTAGDAVLSLLPALLRATGLPAIAIRTAEIVGATALSSLEANEAIASDAEIIKALTEALECGSERVSVAACNAVLDLSTTSFGRQRLCEISALEKLMSVFLHYAASPAMNASLHSISNGSTNGSGEGMIGVGLPVLVLDAAVGLINTCDVKQLMGIPRNLSTTFFSYLKQLWIQVRDKNLLKNATQCSQGMDHTFSNLRIHDLAESIFRFSIYLGQYTINCTTMVIERSMFGPNKSDLEHFMFNHWENSSFLLKNISKPIEDDSYIFSVLFQSFIFKRTIDAVLSSILVGLVSCPPLPSDELDILNFLKEVKDELGSPIYYGQDIRIVKTEEVISGISQGHLKREVHFSNEYADSSYPSGSDSLYNGSGRRCKEALQEGYTIALRGMEFRSEIIAAVADRLAVMFGMPSVGANAYLTPPKSQGLARHYDDHCVFVCQLLGRKQWKIFTRPTLRLPRLYEPCDSLLGCGSDNDASRFEQFLLDEGDILYIPRGCPHEACTAADDNEFEMDDELTGFSLHLTFGIEVEPPLEWEGFAHVSICHWSQNQIQHSATPTPDGSMCSLMNAMSINLLHVGIQLIGNYDPVFRKACMIAGISLPSLDCNKRTTFRYVIDKIDKEAGFTEAFKCVTGAIQAKNDDIFQRMRWLRHIYEEKDSQYVINWNNPLMGFEKLWLLCDGHREDLEAAFMQTKTRFCKDVVFENACESMKVLLQKYMIVRKQYMSGMLSLHCT